MQEARDQSPSLANRCSDPDPHPSGKERLRTPTASLEKHPGVVHRTDTFTCAYCGYSLVGEKQKGHIYYRCHSSECPTTCLRGEAIDAELSAHLQRIPLDEKLVDSLFERLAHLREKSHKTRKSSRLLLEADLAKVKKRLQRLIDARLDREIDEESFRLRKGGLLQEKAELEERIANVNEPKAGPVEKARQKLERMNTALQSFDFTNSDEKRRLVKILTSNRTVDRENVDVKLSFPASLLAKRTDVLCGDPKRDRTRIIEEICDEMVSYYRNHREEEAE